MRSILRKLEMKKSIWLLMFTLAFSGLMSAARIFPVNAQAAEVFVDPKDNIYYTYEKGINDTIKVNVTIANLTGLAGFEFKLNWNSTLLNAVDMEENLFAAVTPSGQVGNIWQLAHDVAAGEVWYAYTYKNLTRAWELGYAPINITTAEGYPEGKLAAAIITLKIMAEPPAEDFVDCALDITVSKPGDMDAVLIPHAVEDGYYKLISPPRPTPLLKVEPELYEATYRNETFDVNVDINNLDAGWQVVGVEFKLRYDAALLTIENVTEGPFLEAFAGPPHQGTLFMGPVYGSDYVLVGVIILADVNGTWHEPFPSGNGTIATITFKVLQGPVVSCNLELFATKIGDIYAQRVNHTKQDGVFIFNVEKLYHDITVYGQTFTVVTTSNSTISPIPVLCLPRQKILTLNASGATGALCFVNITIPKAFMWLEEPTDVWTVLVGGYQITPTIGENGTHTWLYFTFITSEKPIQIISTAIVPEFASNVLLMLSLLLTSIAAATATKLYARRAKKIH